MDEHELVDIHIRIPRWRPRLPAPKRLGPFLPSPGSVLFTLLAIGGLVWAQAVGAVPGAAPAGPDAASTGTVAYQGRLANPAGAPLTGTYGMIFRLYAASTGGAPLWEEQWTGPNSVQVSDGLFNVMLGSLAAIPQNVVTGNSSLWLGITVGSDDEMTPRVQLGSVPFAVQAVTVADGSVTTAKIADGAVTAAKVANDAVTSTKLSLTEASVLLGSNEGIVATAAPGTTFVSLPSLPAGTYLIYGLASSYVDDAGDVDGSVVWDVNNGSSVIYYGPAFNFTAAHGWPAPQSAGFAFVHTLAQTTTLSLSAYKLEGLSAAAAGGATRFGYIRIR